MPSVKRSQLWFVRVDYPRQEVQDKVKKMLEWIDLEKILAVFHNGSTGENPHFHAIITLKSDIQKQSFDVRVKNIFSVKGSQFSSKIWDGKSAAGSYLFHEDTHDIIANRGYSQDDISELKRLNQEVKKVVEINRERGTSKSVQRIIDAVGQDATREEIFHKIMDEIRDGGMYHPGFRLSAVIEEIFIKCCSDASWVDVKHTAWLNLKEKNHW